MNLQHLEQKLLAVARRQEPSDHVPYAFEKRIMALLKDPARRVAEFQWGAALWRASIPCVAIGLFASALAFFSPAPATTSDLSSDMENAVLAVAYQDAATDVN
jgi:hypothetical protein